MSLITQKPSMSKVISKGADVLPTAFHVPNPKYVACVRIGAKNYWSDIYPTRKEAEYRMEEMKLELGYTLIPTIESEGYFPERAEQIQELYKNSGRKCGTYTGLYQETVK